MSVVDAPAPDASVGPLGALLRERRVDAVLFIDDAFDPLTDQEPSREQQDEIWTEVQADGDAFAALAAMGVVDEDGIDAAFVASVLAGSDGPLRAVVASTSYVVEHRNKAQALAPVIAYLARLGVDVRTRGSRDWEAHVDGVQIVFLDWRLGPDGEPTSTLAAATAARAIHERPRRPYLVLISSDPGVKGQSAVFSEASGLVGGMFDAMPKAWLADEVHVGLNLAVILDLYAAGDAVQKFVETLRVQAQAAVPAFLKRIERLTVSDYANLQRFALRKDGHPLGDYLTELFSGLWTDTLFQGDLRPQLAVLDKKDFESLPALTGPSDALADLHYSAAFDTHVGPFRPHPHANGEGEPRVQLSLGDVIVERDRGSPSKVYVVLNPQCDLAESPLGGRTIPDDQSILLVPGTMEPIDHPKRTERKDNYDTPFLKVDGSTKRIHWSEKALKSVPYGEFAAWVAGGRERTARMRPLHALALQSFVSAELNRVGLPNPPPIHDDVDAHVSCAMFGRWTPDRATTSRQGRLVMPRDSKGDRIVFTHSFLVEIASAIGKGLTDGEERRSDWIDKDQEGLAGTRTAMADPAEWRRLSQPFTLPGGGLTLFGGALLVCAKKPTSGLPRRLLVCVTVSTTPAAA